MNSMLPLFHWSSNPVAIDLGFLQIRWYGICWLLAYLGSEFIGRRMFKALGRSEEEVPLLITYAFIGTLIGARLAHCLIYEPVYYGLHPWKIFAIWEGGLASHGGALGLIIGVYLGMRRLSSKIGLVTLLDIAAVPSALGGALIRIGNFMNSEIVGKATDGTYGVIFDQVDSLPRHPVQLYESAAYLVIFVILSVLFWRRPPRVGSGLLAGIFLTTVFVARTILEHWKMPQAAYEMDFAFSVGQWLSIPFVMLGIVLLWRSWHATQIFTARDRTIKL